ncbi:DUF2452 domain-containing protein [Gangjinia marincola]|uniref:DUF2452 domain-containing protein n=1 Tax=Gangjinia marincola TaxID=578463 RepID=A0ABN1MEH6_9FLAO
MTKKKKPDAVVYDDKEDKYNASLLPYASSVSAPKITVPDISFWKNNNVSKVNHHFNTKYTELKAEFEKMQEEFEYNQLIYQANFSFEPIVGETYHLYDAKDGSIFLSPILPQECTFTHRGSFILTTEKLWSKVS